MKAAQFHKTGGPGVLVYEDVADPTPKDGEVLIRIEAVGSPPPFILGAEVAGTIAAASTPEKRGIAERLGADASVDYMTPGWAEKVRGLTDGRGQAHRRKPS